MAVHDAAARGFERGASDYERARPGYPLAVLDLLAEQLPIRCRSRVLDLAAGTGKLTRLLNRTGADVLAVEPVAAMRRELSVVLPDVRVIDGTAEAIPMADESVDVMTVAQAFHWFDAAPALAEIHRVLRANGGLALVWNVRDESVDWVHQFTELIVERSGGRPYTPHHTVTDSAGEAMTERHVVDIAAHGGFGEVHQARFDNPQIVTPDDVVTRAASTSFVSALPDEQRDALLIEVRNLVAEHPRTRGRGHFEFPHFTVVSWCHKQ